MKCLSIYKWIAGSVNDFTKQFQDNDALYKQAEAFWDKLDGISIYVIIILLVLGIGLAAAYYTQYNNQPGRHYHPKHWLYILAATFIATLVITLLVESIMVAPKLDGAFVLELEVALGNAIYASILYFLTSVVWCNFLPTNAYRIFKF